MKNLSLLVLASTAFTSAAVQAYTYSAPYKETLSIPSSSVLRCADDQIVAEGPARKRIDWAYRCGHLDPNLWEYEFTHQWNREARGSVPVPAGHLKYPIFTKKAAPYAIWNVEAGTNNLTSCAVPDDVTFFDVCMSGCYKPDQRVAFESGYKPIGVAASEGKAEKVLTLDGAQSTLDAPVFKLQPVDYFVTTDKDAHEELLVLETASGKLSVTKTHPLVNERGFIASADSFNVGDSLVRSDGSLEAITAKSIEPFFGKVLNLAPVSPVAADNVVVAEGFLNGSHRFQSGGSLEEFSDVVVKRSLSDDLLK